MPALVVVMRSARGWNEAEVDLAQAASDEANIAIANGSASWRVVSVCGVVLAGACCRVGRQSSLIHSRASQELERATSSRIALELPTTTAFRPFYTHRLTLHGGAVADLAAGHGPVAALRGAGIERLFMVDRRSASVDMRFLGIDDYQFVERDVAAMP
jgi:hypothetical protein